MSIGHDIRARRWRAFAFAAAVAAVVAASLLFWQRQTTTHLRNLVLAAPRNELAAVGRHVIVGYEDREELLRLIAAGAVGGVFVTARNAQHLSAVALAAEIASMQNAAADNGFPPLVIATDQEGGFVSRLSPPLSRPPLLSQLAGEAKDVSALDLAAVRASGQAVGRDLAQVGVTLNFAPVVDLNFGLRSVADRHSRIADRAISHDPGIVGAVAGAYCEGLAAAGVQCTLKHFPGLGRVAADTHVGGATLATPVLELEAADWRPFQHVLAATGAAVMVGHVSVDGIDRGQPASTSRAVVHGILRQAWSFRGMVVTDDLTMAATSSMRGGIGAAAVAALDAGVDYVLVSYDAAQVYPVLDALLRSMQARRLSQR